MTQKKVVRIYDDVDGKDITHDGTSVIFSLDGSFYRIDLSHENAAHLRADMKRWIDRAHKIERTVKRQYINTDDDVVVKRQRRDGAASRNKRIREWSKNQGIKIGKVGRIPTNVRLLYEDVHGNA